jgi:hypothetical protein
MREGGMTDELLAAVNALTSSEVTHYAQYDDDGKLIRTHTVTLDPLLDRLVAAIHSSTSGKAGGGNPATRAVLNSDALFASMRITSQITDWCNAARVTPTRNPARDLRAWYSEYEGAEAFYIRQLRKWAWTIRNLLDPPRTFQITAPCPECKATEYTDKEGDIRPHPLRPEYPDPESALEAVVICQACGQMFGGGEFALRSLRFDIDAQEPPREE